VIKNITSFCYYIKKANPFKLWLAQAGKERIENVKVVE